ncbi:MAG: DUF6630 family protein, partial [Clostridia bacterium]
MGIFDILKKKKETEEEIMPRAKVKAKVNFEEVLTEIATLISNNDEKVLSEIKELMSDLLKFQEDYKEIYKGRSFDLSMQPKKDIYWIAIADILKRYGHVLYLDWKIERVDFINALSDFTGKFSEDFSYNSSKLDKDGDVPLWASEIDSQWKLFTLANYCVDSDCYFVFPCNEDMFISLNKLA